MDAESKRGPSEISESEAKAQELVLHPLQENATDAESKTIKQGICDVQMQEVSCDPQCAADNGVSERNDTQCVQEVAKEQTSVACVHSSENSLSDCGRDSEQVRESEQTEIAKPRPADKEQDLPENPQQEPLRQDSLLLPQLCRSLWAKALVVAVICALCCLLPYWWYFKRTVDLPEGAAFVDVSIPSGSSGRLIANRISEAGIGVSADTLVGLLRVQGAALSIHAGRYRFKPGMTLADIVAKLQQGDVEAFSFRIPDGQAIWDLRKAVSNLPDITVTTANLSDAQLREVLGVKEPSLEGLFAPETYNFRTGITDVDVYRAAYREQMRILDKEWNSRSPQAMVKSKYEALILASIIEKETSMQTDRALVSSVFNNRLRIRMPLQTDPTIIYGIGESFNGNLTRRDMQRAGPYNTYLNAGLPPTPISMPTAASIHAALNPQDTKYLYFVARGDGTTHFSKTLAEHNRAVEKYQKAPARKARAEQRRLNNAR